MISNATKAIESAIAASTGFGGTWTKPRVAAAKVMLCATVKAVMALINSRVFRAIRIRASTKSR